MSAKLDQIPSMVVRPSGVWNTRAPFHEYVQQHRSECRTYFCLLLGIERLLSEARKAEPSSPARGFFRAKTVSDTAGFAWHSFKKSHPRGPDGKYPHPTIREAKATLKQGEQAIAEHAIVSYSGMFETYVQCWALNYLLAKLELNVRWTKDEKRLAVKLSPMRGRQPLPGFPLVRDAFPTLKDGLGEIPHIASDPKTGEEVSVPVTPRLNALQIIEFWRDYRNLLVHSSGLVSNHFFECHYELVNEIRAGFPYIPSLELGKRVKLTPAAFRAVASTHYIAARWMNEMIVDLSSERRGHVFAPEPKSESETYAVPRFGKPLVMSGDHPESLRWITDEKFRSQILSLVK